MGLSRKGSRGRALQLARDPPGGALAERLSRTGSRRGISQKVKSGLGNPRLGFQIRGGTPVGRGSTLGFQIRGGSPMGGLYRGTGMGRVPCHFRLGFQIRGGTGHGQGMGKGLHHALPMLFPSTVPPRIGNPRRKWHGTRPMPVPL